MASLWFGAGNNWNPLLRRRQVLYKIPNQSQPSTHGSSEQRVADVWPGICTLLDFYPLLSFSTAISLTTWVIQGKYSSFPARQMKSCQWGLMRNSSPGLLLSGHWRTPVSWARKFWIFAGSFPFTGSNLSFLKVAFISFITYWFIPSHRA